MGFVDFIILGVLVAVPIILYLKTKNDARNKKLQDKNLKSGKIEEWNDLYGYQYLDIPYYYENKDEYKNNQNKNYFDLYIPYWSTYEKDKNQGIIIFFHGLGDTKSNVNYLCSRYTKCGYITAAIETNGCNNCTDKSFSPILNAISSAIKALKNKLVEIGFNPDKLELALYGISAGANTALIYSYSMANKCAIPIKFVIDNVGPVTMEPYAWYSLNDLNDTLENLEIETIQSAIKTKKLIPTYPNDIIYLNYMTFFVGDDYNKEQFEAMLDKNGKIDYNNPDFINLKKKYEKFCALYYINKNSVPTLCMYAGKDIGVSVMQYASLKKKLDENNVYNELVYMRYGGHDTSDAETEDGINAMREFNYKILYFAKKFFSK